MTFSKAEARSGSHGPLGVASRRAGAGVASKGHGVCVCVVGEGVREFVKAKNGKALR